MTTNAIIKAIKKTNSYKIEPYKAMKVESLTQTGAYEYLVAISFKAKKYENNGAEYKLFIDKDGLTAMFEREIYTA